VDYQLSDKQSLFVRNMLVKQITAAPFSLNPANVLAANSVGMDNQFDGFALGDTYLLSANKVNALRLYLNRISTVDPPINIPACGSACPKALGINAYSYTPNYVPMVPVTGTFTLGMAAGSEYAFLCSTAFAANDAFRIVHGSHQFAFGGFFTRSMDWSVQNQYSGALYQVTGLGLADFLLGNASTLRQANPNPLNVSQNFFGLYAQDTWKITPKLTMNYGVNWNPFFGQKFQQGDVYSFSLAGFYAGATSKVVQGGAPGHLQPAPWLAQCSEKGRLPRQA
jgi:hypothetical protein